MDTMMDMYMYHLDDRVRELEIEMTVLDRLQSIEDRENIEYSIQHSDIYWPVSDRWKKRRADFTHRYDETSYTIIIYDQEKRMYSTLMTLMDNNETAWNDYHHTISEHEGEAGIEQIKESNDLQTQYIFETQWEINARFSCVTSDSSELYSAMEEEIALMDLSQYNFTPKWFTRRTAVAEFIAAYTAQRAEMLIESESESGDDGGEITEYDCTDSEYDDDDNADEDDVYV
jgi:hypothetical protein